MATGLRPFGEVTEAASPSRCFECMKWTGAHARPIAAALLIIAAVAASCLLYFHVVSFAVGASMLGASVVFSLLLFVNWDREPLRGRAAEGGHRKYELCELSDSS